MVNHKIIKRIAWIAFSIIAIIFFCYSFPVLLFALYPVGMGVVIVYALFTIGVTVFYVITRKRLANDSRHFSCFTQQNPAYMRNRLTRGDCRVYHLVA